MRRLIVTLIASFALFLLFSIIFVQLQTRVFTETRKSALVETLAQAQLEFGALHFFVNITGIDYYNEGGTSHALITLNTLDGLSRIDIDKAVNYLASQQIADVGGFGAFYGYNDTLLSYDMGFTYYVVHALGMLNALNRIDATAVAGFVLARYNQSTGAFNELPTIVNGKVYAMSHFGLGFRSINSSAAYAIPNVISTYLGVSTLHALGKLDLINATRTLEWVMACQADNAAFKPYPNASFQQLPGWSSLVTNPFDVDSYGTGVPYTFAAVETLKNLGHVSDLNSSVRDKIKEYLLSAQGGDGNFYIHPEYDRAQLSYTYYAIATLREIDMLTNVEALILRVVNHLQQAQLLNAVNSFPLPKPSYTYGLFHDTSTDPLTDTSYAIFILNATDNLALLNRLTPRILQTALNLVFVSALVSLAATATVLTYSKIREKAGPVEENVQ